MSSRLSSFSFAEYLVGKTTQKNFEIPDFVKYILSSDEVSEIFNRSFSIQTISGFLSKHMQSQRYNYAILYTIIYIFQSFSSKMKSVNISQAISEFAFLIGLSYTDCRAVRSLYLLSDNQQQKDAASDFLFQSFPEECRYYAIKKLLEKEDAAEALRVMRYFSLDRSSQISEDNHIIVTCLVANSLAYEALTFIRRICVTPAGVIQDTLKDLLTLLAKESHQWNKWELLCTLPFSERELEVVSSIEKPDSTTDSLLSLHFHKFSDLPSASPYRQMLTPQEGSQAATNS